MHEYENTHHNFLSVLYCEWEWYVKGLNVLSLQSSGEKKDADSVQTTNSIQVKPTRRMENLEELTDWRTSKHKCNCLRGKQNHVVITLNLHLAHTLLFSV